MLLLICVQSGHADEKCASGFVKAVSFYNKASAKYVRVHQQRVVADEEVKHILYMITIGSDWYIDNYAPQFFLYDPIENKFICLQKARGKRPTRLTGKRLIREEDVGECTFQERVKDLSYTQYVVPKHNFTMAFNKNGNPLMKNNHIRHMKKKVDWFLTKILDECHSSRDQFCMNMKPLLKKRVAKQIKQICGG